jgi:hypothetical protein
MVIRGRVSLLENADTVVVMTATGDSLTISRDASGSRVVISGSPEGIRLVLALSAASTDLQACAGLVHVATDVLPPLRSRMLPSVLRPVAT